MGLYVRLNLQVDQIDAERWEEVWLTSLQLLEHFPGPLAAHTVDKRHESRFVLSPQVLFGAGTETEHWQVNGDLASRRFAETYCLYRHLRHYQADARRRRASPGPDILWVPPDQLAEPEEAGLSLFNAKSQGYPYHYAMLAIAILVEDAFPTQAVVHGDIDRTQAEKIIPWAEGVLRRSLHLPVVTDSPRLWRRLCAAYANEPEHAVRRFLTLNSEGRYSAYRALAQLKDGPEGRVLCRVYQSELASYQSLRQRGAAELIAALCEADGGIERVIDWVCRPDHPEAAGRFPPEELLECLCDLLVPIPPDERAASEMLNPPADMLPTIETQFFQAFSGLFGQPVPCTIFVDADTLAAEFAARWPQQAGRFRETIQQRTAKTRANLDKLQIGLDQWLAARPDEEEDTEPYSAAMPAGAAYEPTAEFLYAEIARQQRKAPHAHDVAADFGVQLRTLLPQNRELRQMLETSSPTQLLERISRASHMHGFALRESTWQALAQATTQELRHLLALALIPEHEVQFWEARLHVLETPDLWPVLAGTDMAR